MLKVKMKFSILSRLANPWHSSYTYCKHWLHICMSIILTSLHKWQNQLIFGWLPLVSGLVVSICLRHSFINVYLISFWFSYYVIYHYDLIIVPFDIFRVFLLNLFTYGHETTLNHILCTVVLGFSFWVLLTPFGDPSTSQ